MFFPLFYLWVCVCVCVSTVVLCCVSFEITWLSPFGLHESRHHYLSSPANPNEFWEFSEEEKNEKELHVKVQAQVYSSWSKMLQTELLFLHIDVFLLKICRWEIDKEWKRERGGYYIHSWMGPGRISNFIAGSVQQHFNYKKRHYNP